MTRLAKPEKKAGKGNERRGMYAKRLGKAIGRRCLNLPGYNRPEDRACRLVSVFVAWTEQQARQLVQ